MTFNGNILSITCNILRRYIENNMVIYYVLLASNTYYNTRIYSNLFFFGITSNTGGNTYE